MLFFFFNNSLGSLFSSYGGRRCQQVLRPLLPLKLKDSCRITIRQQFITDIHRAIDQLPLPRPLKNFLLMSESNHAIISTKQELSSGCEGTGDQASSSADLRRHRRGPSSRHRHCHDTEFPFVRL